MGLISPQDCRGIAENSIGWVLMFGHQLEMASLLVSLLLGEATKEVLVTVLVLELQWEESLDARRGVHAG